MAKSPTPESPRSPRMTVPKFAALKGSGQKITMVTAYDFPFARLVDEAGVEGVLVGDSMSMVVQGHENTLPVTLDEMIYHAEMVGRAVNHALVVVDMPFPSYHIGKYKAVENAGRILKETRCQAVKLEGGAEQAEVISNLASPGRCHGGGVGGRFCHVARLHSRLARRANHQACKDPHHRHRRRSRLRRSD